ncbi:hypothetical protein EO98_02630 [Methanosarcina sp. 2.H.T.1A.6]|uniref:hypothetical protein n=2 Tax=Methanosarcina TaxID=2207 RepID=UPI000621A73F|nr:hypothetical protein [Methanosarcina sp. 2.H.T.1A.6]KKG18496.1 hypothetical protein EO94_04810 [Methanosarcina sp. 2.H.T.1A.3]KKG21151.1 hypothetical protein EO96_01315 [Methanosarcina sp. 2.H.T.1A.8]KKG22201.1 hypothetical protein EO97_06285 [Methanosarcina sp. 2.H.T.1A.15]KKG22335.1 hypothetical protein EO98_02630 [Methanosarcina sp. 2.H.T.1A.6]
MLFLDTEKELAKGTVKTEHIRLLPGNRSLLLNLMGAIQKKAFIKRKNTLGDTLVVGHND